MRSFFVITLIVLGVEGRELTSKPSKLMRKEHAKENQNRHQRLESEPVAEVENSNKDHHHHAKPAENLDKDHHHAKPVKTGKNTSQAQESITESIRSRLDAGIKQVEYELNMLPKAPTKTSKVRFALLSQFLPFGIFGCDRCFMNQRCLGFIKFITCGGFGIWALLDYVVIFINMMAGYNSIDALGFHAKFGAKTEIDDAFYLTLFLLFLSFPTLGATAVGVRSFLLGGQEIDITLTKDEVGDITVTNDGVVILGDKAKGGKLELCGKILKIKKEKEYVEFTQPAWEDAKKVVESTEDAAKKIEIKFQKATALSKKEAAEIKFENEAEGVVKTAGEAKAEGVEEGGKITHVNGKDFAIEVWKSLTANEGGESGSGSSEADTSNKGFSSMFGGNKEDTILIHFEKGKKTPTPGQ